MYSNCRKPEFILVIEADLKASPLELCAEDYYGVWELYWNYQGLMGTKEVDDELFISVLQELMATGKIVPFDKSTHTNEFEATTIDLERLRSELRETRSGNVGWDFYWFSYA